MDVLDFRNLKTGLEIPSENYCDQPYIIKTDDDAWLCVLTTGRGMEGQRGQHVMTCRSTDCGKTWSIPVSVESANGPEASYAVLIKVPSGRIYCFYNHNTDELDRVRADEKYYPGGYTKRVDSQGHFVFKYSDDHGRTWSIKRYDLPIRTTQIDRDNPYGGKIKYFWNVGKPFIYDDAAFVPLIKIGGFGYGFFSSTEGVLLKSCDILKQSDPENIKWETLPDGEIGIRAPLGGSPVAEEHSYSVLSDGSFYCVYRTIDGQPAYTYSRDGGHTWEIPQYKKYADGTPFRNPRAANFCWKCENGKYLYWYHNNGGTWYDGRNPVWIAGGVEEDSPNGRIIKWGQGEILLYDDDPGLRISYPDYIEHNGRCFFTETQKSIARVHEIPVEFIEKLWQQFAINEVCTKGLIVQHTKGGSMTMPNLPDFLCKDTKSANAGTLDMRTGFSLDIRADFTVLTPYQNFFDSRDANGSGICLRVGDRNNVEIIISDGITQNVWSSDANMIMPGQHHIAVVVDGGPKLIRFIIDGKQCDGGGERTYGFGHYSPNLRHVNGAQTAQVGTPDIEVTIIRIYDRALMTTDMIGNWRSGK